MRFLILALGFLLVIPARAEFFPDQFAFAQLANDTVAVTWQRLADCGLGRFNAYDPRLPRPQVPADEAVVSRAGQVLAYSFQPWVHYYEFKNPNGGSIHAVHFSSQAIGFQTPYAGTVAAANRINYGGVWTVQYFCRGIPTDYESFLECVRTQFVGVIASQLCRF